MMSLLRAFTERLRALFVTDAAMSFEAELLARAAERQADLLRRADRYDDEGLHGIADHLRRRAEEIDLRRPLAGVLPAMEHLTTSLDGGEAPPLLRLASPDAPDQPKVSRSSPGPNTKKGGKS